MQKYADYIKQIEMDSLEHMTGELTTCIQSFHNFIQYRTFADTIDTAQTGEERSGSGI